MTRSNLPLTVMLASALVGIVPSVLAGYRAPGPWTIFAMLGATVATTSLLMGGVRSARKAVTAERRERELQSTVATSEARIAGLEAKLRDAAAHDEVTGTLNRRTFLRRLDEVLQRDTRLQKPMALLLIDIDGFKKINADSGRVIGDRALRTVGRSIQASTRGTDFVGRIGGDEFAVVLGECSDPRPAVDRLFVALHGEMSGGDHRVPIRVSVGIVTVDEPHETVDPVELFRRAEEALASARESGGGLCSKRAYRAESGSPAGVTGTPPRR